VQFWQLKKADGKVSDMPFFQPCICSYTFHRHSTSIVRHNLLLVSPAPHFILVATKTPQETPPKLGRGALCADSMGLYVSSFSTPAYAKRPEGGKLSQ